MIAGSLTCVPKVREPEMFSPKPMFTEAARGIRNPRTLPRGGRERKVHGSQPTSELALGLAAGGRICAAVDGVVLQAWKERKASVESDIESAGQARKNLHFE